MPLTSSHFQVVREKKLAFWSLQCVATFIVLLSGSLRSCFAENWPRMQGPHDTGKIAKQSVRFDWKEELKVAWRIAVGEGYGNAVVHDGNVYHFDRYDEVERLTCYKLQDGAELWKLEFPVEYTDSFGYNNGPRAMPVTNGEYVAAYGAAGRLILANAKTGELKWQKDVSADYNVEPNFFGVGSTPLIHKGKLIVMVGGSPKSGQKMGLGRLNQRAAGDSGIVAFDLETGKELYRTGSYLASYSAPIVKNIDGRELGFAFMREGLFVFDPATGAEQAFYPWRASINESVNAAWPVIDGNQIFLSETYEIGSVMLSFRKGALVKLWADPEYKKDQSFRAHWATPVLIDGVLYGCSGRNEPDAELRAVKWADGEVLWSKRTHARSNVIAIGDYILALDEYGVLQLIKPNPKKLDVVSTIELMHNEQFKDGPLLGSPVWAPPAFADSRLLVRGGKYLVALQLDSTDAKTIGSAKPEVPKGD